MDHRYFDYLLEFNGTRDYYKCHDFLEEWWYEINHPKDHILVAFIQLAVGMFQWRRGNINGANKMFEGAYFIFEAHKDEIIDYGIDEEKLFEIITRVHKSMLYHEDFYDVNLPLIDKTMLSKLETLASDRDLRLYQASNLDDYHLVHKHLKRIS